VTDEPQNASEPEQSENGPKDEAKPSTSRADRPKASTSNPLGEEQRGFSNAFWQGQKFLSPEMSRLGPSATIGRADIRDMQIGNRTQIFIGQSVSKTLGSIQEEDLAWVRSRYLEVSGYEGMADILADRRVLLLRGRSGTGRSTTALHLLDRVATARVLRVEGHRAISDPEKRDFPEENAGYVAVLSRADAGGVTTEKLDKLRDVLTSQSAFCVLISDDDPRDLDLFGGYAAVYTAPDPVALLRKHTYEEVLADDPPDVEDRLLVCSTASGWPRRSVRVRARWSLSASPSGWRNTPAARSRGKTSSVRPPRPCGSRSRNGSRRCGRWKPVPNTTKHSI
jgi:hypothetical protein